MPVLSDVVWIFVVLTSLYLFESLAWVPTGCVAFRSFFGRFRCPTRTIHLIGNEAGHLPSFGLLPTDATLVVEPCPVSVGHDGVVGYVVASLPEIETAAATGVHADWQSVGKMEVRERELRVNGQVLIRLATARSAGLLASRLRTIAAVADTKRAEAIERFIEEQFDCASVVQRIDGWRKATVGLKFASLALFIWIFPVGIARYQGWLPGFSDMQSLPLYLGILFLLWWAGVMGIVRAHRRLYPERRGQRWKYFFTAMISPAVVLRGVDHLGRGIIAMVHPVVVAEELCGASDVKNWAERISRDYRFPRASQSGSLASDDWLSPTAKEIVDSYHRRSLQAWERFAARQGLDLTTGLLPPERDDPQAVSYCPRCHQEFAVIASQCDRCGDLATVEFVSR